MLIFSLATADVEMMSVKTGKPWGILKVGLSWEGRDTIAAKAIAAKGLREISQSKVLDPMFVYNDYAKTPRKISLV